MSPVSVWLNSVAFDCVEDPVPYGDCVVCAIARTSAVNSVYARVVSIVLAEFLDRGDARRAFVRSSRPLKIACASSRESDVVVCDLKLETPLFGVVLST